MYVSKLTKVFVLVTLLTGMTTISSAKVVSKNETVLLQEKIKNLQKEITYLNQKLLKLESENEKLKSQIRELENWDARKLMDKLFIFHITEYSKEYKLLFHEGGLGGIAVYQYVGPWLGDAGEWRQYKQIAQLKTTKLSRGYIKPGLVLKPIWGFNNSTIVIRSIGDLLRIEKNINSVNGLAKYVEWLRSNYVKTTRYNAGTIVICCLIALIVGSVIGETSKPITKLSEIVTVRAMTDFGERKRRFPKILILIVLITGFEAVILSVTPSVVGLIVSVVFISITVALYRFVY